METLSAHRSGGAQEADESMTSTAIKKAARDRQRRTGEPYTAALAAVKAERGARSGALLLVGSSLDGRAEHLDLERDPHLLLLGRAGSGKSATIARMLAAARRDGFDIRVIDLAHRGECAAGIRPEIEVATDLASALEALEQVNAEASARVDLLRRRSATSIDRLPAGVRPARMLVVVDNLHSLVGDGLHWPFDEDGEAEREDRRRCREVIVDGVRKLRFVGIHFVLAAQVIPDSDLRSDLLANTATMLCGKASRIERAVVFGDRGEVPEHPGGLAGILADSSGIRAVRIGRPARMMPATPDWDAIEHPGFRLPLGSRPDGETVFLDHREDAHLLVIGRSGSGKSAALMFMVEAMLLGGAEVHLADPMKGGADFAFAKPWLRGFAATIDQTIALLEGIRAEGERRSRLRAEHDASHVRDLPEGLRPRRLYAVVDELPAILDLAPGLPGAEHEARLRIGALIGRIARDLRADDIHLVVAGQSLARIPGGASVTSTMAVLALGAMPPAALASALKRPDDAPRAEGTPGTGVFEGSMPPTEAVSIWWESEGGQPVPAGRMREILADRLRSRLGQPGPGGEPEPGLPSIAFIGRPGVGKTFQMRAMLRDAVSAGCRVIAVDASGTGELGGLDGVERMELGAAVEEALEAGREPGPPIILAVDDIDHADSIPDGIGRLAAGRGPVRLLLSGWLPSAPEVLGRCEMTIALEPHPADDRMLAGLLGREIEIPAVARERRRGAVFGPSSETGVYDADGDRAHSG